MAGKGAQNAWAIAAAEARPTRTSVAGLSMALTPFPEGSMTGSDPPAEGGMARENTPALPDADHEGIPKGGVAPISGRNPERHRQRPAAVPQAVRQWPGT